MTRFVRMKCPKCGGMYLKDGRCETCGYLIIEKPAVQTQQPLNKPAEAQVQPIVNQTAGNTVNMIL